MNGILSGIILTIILSLAQGVSVIHLCVAKTSSSITCASGEVVLIKEVFRVQVTFSSQEHCGYQNGDFKEYYASAIRSVWKDCNLWPICNVKFVPTSRKEFLEIHYECLSRTAIPKLSICQASNLEGNHGYIHSPGYPGLTPLASVPVRCNCSATLSRTSNITVKVFNTFSDGQQTLQVKWDIQLTTLIQRYPHFKEYTHAATKIFSLDFSSNIRDPKFWLEYTTETPLRIHCNNKTFITTKTTTSMPKPTTTKTITSTTTTETTTTSSERTQTPTNADKTSYAALDTDVSSSSKYGPTVRHQKKDSSSITLGVFLGVAMILIVILTTLLLHRMGVFARCCRGRADDGKQDDADQVQLENGLAFRPEGVYENVGTNYENVDGPGIANTAFTDIQDSEINGNLVTNDSDLYANVGATAAARVPSGPTKRKAGTYENVGSNYENNTVGGALPEDSAYQEVGGRSDGGVSHQVVDPGQRELDSTYASIGTIHDRPEHSEYAELRQAH